MKSPFGIDALDAEQQESSREEQARQQSINANFGKCFNSPSGKKVLEHLSKMTVDQPTWIPSGGVLDGASTIHHGFVREGQNSIVREILARVNQSKGK
jgi:hypothetical protein